MAKGEPAMSEIGKLAAIGLGSVVIGNAIAAFFRRVNRRRDARRRRLLKRPDAP